MVASCRATAHRRLHQRAFPVSATRRSWMYRSLTHDGVRAEPVGCAEQDLRPSDVFLRGVAIPNDRLAPMAISRGNLVIDAGAPAADSHAPAAKVTSNKTRPSAIPSERRRRHSSPWQLALLTH